MGAPLGRCSAAAGLRSSAAPAPSSSRRRRGGPEAGGRQPRPARHQGRHRAQGHLARREVCSARLGDRCGCQGRTLPSEAPHLFVRLLETRHRHLYVPIPQHHCRVETARLFDRGHELPPVVVVLMVVVMVVVVVVVSPRPQGSLGSRRAVRCRPRCAMLARYCAPHHRSATPSLRETDRRRRCPAPRRRRRLG